MKSIFTPLISYSPREKRTPTEDFVTELLCGILNKMPDLRQKFIEYIVGEPNDWSLAKNDWGNDWSNLRIETQWTLPSGVRPDIAVLDKNNDKKFLIEHKIDCPIGKKQLKSYADEIGDNGLGVILLTKYHHLTDEEKEELCKPNSTPLRTVWWHNLYDFFYDYYCNLPNQESSCQLCLLREFITFLKEIGMKEPRNFQPEDHNAMKRIFPLIGMFDRVISGDIESEFKNLVHKTVSGAAMSTQLQEHGRYAMYGDLISQRYKVMLFLGFHFNEEFLKHLRMGEYTNVEPVAFVSVEIDPNIQQKNKVSSVLQNFADSHEHWNNFEYLSDHWTNIVTFCVLSKLSSNDHISELQKWFKEQLVLLGKYSIKSKLEKF